MIRVSVEIREGVFTRRVRITAPSIERALRMAGDGKPARRVRLLFPINPDDFFLPHLPVRGRRREMELMAVR
jgi:hypothetical protein